jgi:hypothetical protein
MSGDGPLVNGEGSAGPQADEEPAVTDTPPWHIKALVFLTIYGKLSAARTPAEFGRAREMLQLEWTFQGGVVSRFTIAPLDSQLIYYSDSSYPLLRKIFFPLSQIG